MPMGWARAWAHRRMLGYTLWDEWRVPERSLYLPGHPEKNVQSFSGLYFVDPASLSRKSKSPLYKPSYSS